MTLVPSSYCPACFHAFAGEPDLCPNLACRREIPRDGWLQMLNPGEHLDHNYRIIELVAVGGAGVTYRAQELDAQGEPQLPDLAIKVLHTRRSSGSFLQRLANEARILQGLHHDHVVECVGFVQRRGRPPYLVTRFERGGTLETWARKNGRLPPWTVAGILRQLFEGLSAAHRKGVVHRDLKPANILLAHDVARTEIPHIRIADFGIAKVTGKLNEGLTRVGAFIGTPRYAAPEQFTGAPATSATDVFAAGAIALELLSGEPWIQEPDGGDLEDWHHAALAALPPQLPSVLLRSNRAMQLQDLLAGTMHPNPDERWNTAEVVEYLDFVLGMRAEAPEWLNKPADATERLTEPGLSQAPPPAPTQLAPASAPAPPPRALPRPAGPPGGSAAAPPASLPPLDAPPPALAQPRRSASLPAPAPVPLRSPEALPGPSSLVPRRAPRTIAGDHGDDPWAAVALTDVGGGADLDRLLEVQAPAAVRSAGPGVAPMVLAAGPIVVQSTGDPFWRPARPQPLPRQPAGTTEDLLRLLSVVDPADRRELGRLLAGVPAHRLDEAVRAHRPGGDPSLGRGIGLAAELLCRRSWEEDLRALLADPEPGVRVSAAAGLARVGEDLRSAETLGNLLADTEADVRLAAVRGFAQVAIRSGRERAAAYTLKPLLYDSDPRVQDAAEVALVDLE